MQAMLSILQAILCIFFPFVSIWLARSYRLANWLSPVVLCYLFGMLIANLGIFAVNKDLAKTFAELTVPIAIPLLLFNTDFMRWLRLAKTTLISFGLMIVAVTVSASLAYWLFSSKVQGAAHISAMLSGMYTGGMPNVIAIGAALKTDKSLIILVNTCDVIVGGAYLLFLITFAQRFLLLFLPPFKSSLPSADASDAMQANASQTSPKPAFSPIEALRKVWRSLLLAIGLSLLILGISVGVSLVLTKAISEITVILTLSTLALLASFRAEVRELAGSYEAGDYILLIFCVAIGLMTDLSQVVKAGTGVFLYTSFIMFVAIFIHFALVALLRIDADTALITSAAGIYGPAFIGTIASAIKNREIVVSGITTGLIGYAVGTYLGIFLYYFLR